MEGIMLSGMVPEPPVILCRDEDAQLLVMYALHKDWSKLPTVCIMEEWPEAWANVNAVVATPLNVLGTERATSFEIVGDQEITAEERQILNAYLTIMRTGSSVGRAKYRDLVTATGMNRRTIQKHVKSLAEKGVGTYRFKDGYRLDIGKWIVDAEKAKALGIKIKEY